MNTTGRLYHLDWLRVIAILFVFFHHCSKFFDYHTYTVYNAERSLALTLFRDFNFIWMMPLFFVISGASVFFSLKSRSPGGFIKERFLRILIPLVLVGTFVINPPQVYVERLLKGQTGLGFLQWYPHFFDGFYLAGGNFAPLGMGTHLWYLQYLFIYSLIFLPLFVFGRKSGQSLLSRLSRRFVRPWALLLLFIPISLTAVAAELMGLGITRVAGGWDPLTFILFFIFGYLIFANQTIQETVVRCGPACLLAAAVLTVLFLVNQSGAAAIKPSPFRYVAGGWLGPPAAVQAFRGLIAWCWLIGLLGVGRRCLNFSNRGLSYSNQAVLPFYILHLTIIIAIGYFIIPWELGIVAKLILIATSSFAAIMAIYEYVIRRFNIVRFLFGLKLPGRKVNP